MSKQALIFFLKNGRLEVLQINSIMEFGNNIKVLAQDDSHVILQVKDNTGEGIMTIYSPFEGVYINISDMHMQCCESGFILDKNANVICFDHCKEGRIELDTGKDVVYSVLQEKQLRIDDRRHHSGHVLMPLNHFHGISIYVNVDLAAQGITEIMPRFSVSIQELKYKFCTEGVPYIIKNDVMVESIMACLYDPPANIGSDYYKIKILELLLYLDTVEMQEKIRKEVHAFYGYADKLREIHAQITENLSVHFTIKELSEEYDIPQTELKNSFKAVYGDSIYSYLRRYRINMAASMLIKNLDLSITSIARFVGYKSTGKFSAAFRQIIGTTPLNYRKHRTRQADNLINL